MPAIPAPPKTTTRPSPRTPSPAQSSVHLSSDTFETKVSPAPSSIHRTPSDQHCSWARLALPTFSSSHTSRQHQQISYRVFFVTLILFLHRSDITIIKCLWNTCTKYVGPRRQQTTKRGESAQPKRGNMPIGTPQSYGAVRHQKKELRSSVGYIVNRFMLDKSICTNHHLFLQIHCSSDERLERNVLNVCVHVEHQVIHEMQHTANELDLFRLEIGFSKLIQGRGVPGE